MLFQAEKLTTIVSDTRSALSWLHCANLECVAFRLYDAQLTIATDQARAR